MLRWLCAFHFHGWIDSGDDLSNLEVVSADRANVVRSSIHDHIEHQARQVAAPIERAFDRRADCLQSITPAAIGSLVVSRFAPLARSTAGRVTRCCSVALLLCAHASWAAAPDSRAAAAQPPPAQPVAPATAADATPPSEPHLGFIPYRGLVVTSGDENFELGLALRVQLLSIIEHSRGTDPQQTFQVRRARAGSSGHIVRPEFKYRFEFAFGPREVNTAGGVPQTSPLLDVVFDWQRYRDVNVRVGQYKVPLDRQRIIPFFKLQFVDRAITDTEFSFDRDVGLDLHSNDLFGLKLFRYNLGVFTGDGRNSFQLDDFGLTYVARAEVLPFGLFDDYSEGDFDRGGLRASFGVAYLLIERAPRERGILGAVPADGGTTDLQVATADALVQFRGLSLLSAFFFRNSRRNPGPLVDDAGAPLLGPDGAPLGIAPSRDGVGFLIQGGYLLPYFPLELAARYAVVDGTNAPNRDGLVRSEEFAGALNYYVERHQLKLQANYTRIALDGDYTGALGRAHLQLQASF